MPHVRFGDPVTRCQFSDGRWTVSTASGHHDEVDVVIAATGVLHHPRYPDIEGLDTFAGTMFHSSRWDHQARIDGARLGIIGTGSTAVQIVSGVVDRVAHLSLFQRTAQWVMPHENPAYSEDEREAWRADPGGLAGTRQQLSDMFDIFSNAVVDSESPEIKMIEQACLANLEDNVHDPVLRERLRPDYRAACKRLVISPDFYAAIQRPNAELVTDADQECRAGRCPHRGRPAPRARRPGPGHRLPCRRLHAADGGHRSQRRDPRPGLDPPTGGVPVGLRPRVPQFLHAQRSQRTGREFLAHRGGRAPVPLHPAAPRTPAVRGVPGGLRHPRRPGRVRAGPRGCGTHHGVGHRLPELVPRRPGRAHRMAVVVRPVPRRDGEPRPARPTSSCKPLPPAGQERPEEGGWVGVGC